MVIVVRLMEGAGAGITGDQWGRALTGTTPWQHVCSLCTQSKNCRCFFKKQQLSVPKPTLEVSYQASCVCRSQMSIVPEVVPGLQQYQQSTVTAGDDAKDAALCKSYICNAIRPKDIDKQVVPMPPNAAGH